MATLRWKRRRIRREHEEAEEGEGGELNLVPYLDIVTNIIMFLMMTTAFTGALSSIAVAQPVRGKCGGCQEPRPLELSVHVGRDGFTVATAGSVEPRIAAAGGGLDFAALGRRAAALKAAHPDETHVTVSAAPDVPYETVIAAMDALRGSDASPLFPDVALAAGVQ